MALKNTDPNAEYPYYFMVSQSIHQRTIEFATDPAYYTIAIIWKAYKVENGEIIYDENSQYSYYDENFYQTAVTKYMGGDLTDVNTLGAQELSVKSIIEGELGITLEVV